MLFTHRRTPPLVFLLIFAVTVSSLAYGSLQSGGVFDSIDVEFKVGLRSSDVVVVNNSDLILAERRTTRKDPTTNFREYTGGWNISDGHYWAVSSFFSPFFTELCCFEF